MALNLPYSDSEDVRKHQLKSLDRPVKGQKLLAHRDKTAQEKAHEQREMQAALKRDERKCRVPRCLWPKLPVDPAHMKHRGMGGNPSGDRTERKTVISLCRLHHGLYDRGVDLDIQPQTEALFDGPCDYLMPDANGWFVFASERRIGVPVTRDGR